LLKVSILNKLLPWREFKAKCRSLPNIVAKTPSSWQFCPLAAALTFINFGNYNFIMENDLEVIEITDAQKIIRVKKAMIDGSHFEDVSARNIKIEDANLSDLEIEGAQLGGAFKHNIGMPPKGHPFYDAEARQRPLRFENCDLNGSVIANCNLVGVDISNCNIEGLKINGILISDLLKAYQGAG
jgi:uncharacterized protein YjbI with pentapeptide repeats